MSKTAKLLAIFNITNNSFTGDGDVYYSDVPAIEKILKQVAQGASIIDLGAEAMCPGSIEISPQAEIERLSVVLPALVAEKNRTAPPRFQISIDTRNPETAEWGIKQGVDIINDVNALKDDRMKQLAATHKHITWVFMHNLGTPPDKTVTLPQDQDAVEIVYKWAEAKLQEFASWGIEKEQVIFDPGIAFGKTALQSLELVARVGEFKKLGVRLCVGHSRKTYFTPLPAEASVEERDTLTAKLSRYMKEQGVEYLRVHAIQKNHDAIFDKGDYTLPAGWPEEFRRGLQERRLFRRTSNPRPTPPG